MLLRVIGGVIGATVNTVLAGVSPRRRPPAGGPWASSATSRTIHLEEIDPCS